VRLLFWLSVYGVVEGLVYIHQEVSVWGQSWDDLVSENFVAGFAIVRVVAHGRGIVVVECKHIELGSVVIEFQVLPVFGCVDCNLWVCEGF